MASPPTSEQWVECGCGERHWGRHGAAGLLLIDDGRVLLQHRSERSHHGGTWGMPGGARLEGESAVVGALREAVEETGIDAAAVAVRATWLVSHPDWSYTTVAARLVAPVQPRVADAESIAVQWVRMEQVPDRPLLPAFADLWPTLLPQFRSEVHLVVDAANVVGARPDGWWRDRQGATERLLAGLGPLVTRGIDAKDLGLPGQRWWPRWHVITEGAARGATSPPDSGIAVVPASGSGDDEITATVARLHDAGDRVLLVSSDRGLRDRTRQATHLGSGWLRTLADR